MPKLDLVFREIHLGSMPGFSMAESFSVTALAPGLTVVHGPNGIGKSTLARAMQLLLWSDLPAGPEVFLEARLDLGGVPQRRIRARNELRVVAADGAPMPGPVPFYGRELQCRYQIGIQDLLQKELPEKESAGEFAKAIRKETVGVDLDAIGERLNARSAFSSGKPKLVNDLQDARATVGELRSRQGRDRNLETEIADLERELKGRPEKVRQQDFWKEQAELLPELEDLLEREASLLPFAADEDRLGRMGAHSGDDFRTRQEARDQAKASADKAQLSREALERALKALKFPGEIREEDREEVRGLLRDLPLANAAQEDAETQERVSQARRDAWQASCGWLAGLDGELPPVTEPILDAAHQIAEKLEAARAAGSAWGLVRDSLADPALEPAKETVLDSLKRLQEWLGADARIRARLAWEEQERAARSRTAYLRWAAGLALALLAAVAVALLRGTAGVAASIAGWVVLAATAAVLATLGILARSSQARGAGEDEALRHKAEEDLAQHGHGLAEWTPAAARQLLDQLLAKEAAFRAWEVQARLVRLAEEGIRAQERLKTETLEAARALPGFEAGPALPEPRVGYLGLVVYQVKELQKHREAAAAAASLRRSIADKADALKAKVRAVITRHGRVPGLDPAADLEVLLGNLTEALGLQAECVRLGRTLKEEEGRWRTAAAKVETFLAEHGEVAEAGFPELCKRWASWSACLQKYEDKRRALQDRRFSNPATRDLADTFLDRAGRPLAERRAELAKRRIQVVGAWVAAQATVADLEGILVTLVNRKKDLERFTSEGALARAIQVQEAAARALEDLRLEELEARSLDLVLARQKDLAEEKDRPEVVQRASDLFFGFTNRYHLTYADGQFMAKDGARRVALDELSDGTRVQLLLAVRLAFVDLKEEVRLPVFLDEVLANADDARADAIVRTVLEIARTGRQVFYFTAQRDELARWQRHGAGVLNPPVHLAELRNLALVDHLPMPETEWEVPEVPDPAGRPMLAYVRDLPGAAGPSIWKPLDDQHPYHVLMDGDEDRLAGLLRMGVHSLALMRRFLAEAREQPYPDIAATLRILDGAQALLQKHRPRILTSQDILDIDLAGFGPSYREKFIKHLQEHPGEDLQAIMDRGLPTAFKAREEGLREWLVEHRFLVPDGLDAEAIWVTLRQLMKDQLPEDSPRWQVVGRFVFHAGLENLTLV